MKTAFFMVTAAILFPLFAEPLPPMNMKLEAKKIQTIPIHSKAQTLLLFPEPVGLVSGEGITNGEKPGLVHAQPADDQRVLILRSLHPTAEVLMHVLVGQEAYVFRLQHREQAASIVRFHQGEKASPAAKEMSRKDVENERIFPSSERQGQLVRLVQQADWLRDQLSEEYKGYQSRRFQQFHQGEIFSVELQQIARFPEERTMIIFACLQNTSPSAASPKKLYLKVGKQRFYRLHLGEIVHKVFAPGERFHIATIFVGDGKGGSLHVSLENDFELVFNPHPKKS